MKFKQSNGLFLSFFFFPSLPLHDMAFWCKRNSHNVNQKGILAGIMPSLVFMHLFCFGIFVFKIKRKHVSTHDQISFLL